MAGDPNSETQECREMQAELWTAISEPVNGPGTSSQLRSYARNRVLDVKDPPNTDSSGANVPLIDRGLPPRKRKRMTGDTQVNPSQVERDYLTARSRSNDTTSRGATYATGDTGYVDFAQVGIGHTDDQLPTRDSSLEASDCSQIVQDDAQSETVSPELTRNVHAQSVFHHTRVRFDSVTPLAGRKHDRDGRVIDTARSQDPQHDLAAFFDDGAGKQAKIGMTQLFNNTQAGSSSPTSPVALRSDPVFARPSPEPQGATRSSPPLPTSSPTTVRKITSFSTSVGPREEYQPLGESQRQREEYESIQRSSPRQIHFDDDEDDDLWEDDLGRADAERRRKKKLIECSARSQFLGLAAPTPAKLDRRRKSFAAQTVIGLVTPRDRTKPDNLGREVITISSDSKTPQANLLGDDGDTSSVDEYDELSQAVVTSCRKPSNSQSPAKMQDHETEQDAPRPNSSPVSGKYANPSRQSLRHVHTVHVHDLSPRVGGAPSQNDTPFELRACVQNSQPEHYSSDSKSIRRPLLPSSITSAGFVLQSQLPTTLDHMQCLEYGPDMVAKALQTSSIPPAPILSGSSPPTEERGAPSDTPASSPPVTRIEAESAASHLPDTVAVNKDLEMAVDERVPEADKPADLRRPSTATSDQSKENCAPGLLSSRSHSKGSLKVPETSPMIGITRHKDLSDQASPMGSLRRTRLSQARSTGTHATTDQSEQSEVFKTAPSTMPAQRLTQTPRSSPRRKSTSTPSSIHRPGVRKMVDIAGSQTPTASSDPLNAQDFSILNAEDEKYQSAMRSMTTEARQSKRPKFKDTRDLSRREFDKLVVHGGDVDVPAPSKAISNPRQTLSTRPAETSEALKTPVQAVDALDAVSHRLRSQMPISADGHRNSEDHNVEPVGPSKMRPAVEVPARPAGKSPKNNGFRNDTRKSGSMSRPPPLEVVPHQRQTSSASLKLAEKQAFPNRVLAMFKGSVQAFYPATCSGRAASPGTAVKVKFDDGSESTVERHLVKRLEFFEGDLVKVDIRGEKNRIFIVQSLKTQKTSEDYNPKDGHGKDVHGNNIVSLLPRQRASLPKVSSTEATNIIDIDIESVYITPTMWSNLKNREFSSSVLPPESRPQTPSDRLFTPSTPSSRTRNMGINTTAAADGKATALSFLPSDGVFANMAFCVSFSGQKDDERCKAVAAISANGGHVLEGFDLLFERSESSPVSPSGSTEKTNEVSSTLGLAKSAINLGFVALIADQHSRRNKHIQALALNLPCIHFRWVSDSIRRASVQPINEYLLPAGESHFLQGAIRSRTIGGIHGLSTDMPRDAKLAQLIENRSPLLKDKKLMLITGAGKLGESRNVYTFLVRAAFAYRVTTVKDIPAAKSTLKVDSKWDLIVVDDSRVEDATVKLFGLSEKGHNARKVSKSNRAQDTASSKGMKVIGYEIILQSFILGTWYDED